MRFRAELVYGLLISASVACGGSSTAPADVAAFGASQPAALQQIDRVSLLAWKETLGPLYPLTISRSDSINAVVEFFESSSAKWTETSTLTGVPMLAGFYRGDQLESERGFIEVSRATGGVLLIREGGKVYSRPASADEISRFLGFFGIGVVSIPN